VCEFLISLVESQPLSCSTKAAESSLRDSLGEVINVRKRGLHEVHKVRHISCMIQFLLFSLLKV
jgi:hypothetical protein